MSQPLATPRVRLPRTARAGEVVEIRTLMEHPMETGLRRAGAPGVARDMLTQMVVRMNGEVVFSAGLHNGTSANPYHVFFLRIERSSQLHFTWTDEQGRTARTEARITVA